MRPLEGLKVLDFSRVVAGPYIGRVLCDLGAEVVKIEPPDGDVTRIWGLVIQGIPGFFQQQNAGKKNISVDLRADGATALIKEMVAKADIVVENYRAGVMDRLGLGWSDLSAVNSRLIMASVSGFGQGGPESGRGAFAPVTHAETGVPYRQAEFDGNRPTDPMISIADHNAALHATVGLLAALHAMKATGHGSHVDIAMFDAMLATDDYIHHAIDDSEVVRLGGEYYRLPEGGWILISGQFRHLWAQLSKARMIQDPAPKDADLTTKIAMRKVVVNEWLATFTADAELKVALDRARLDWGVLMSPRDALRTPTALHRGVVAQVDDRRGGTRGVIQTPYRFSAYESGVVGGGAHRGEHNESVLADWLGYDAARIDALTSAGVLLAEDQG